MAEDKGLCILSHFSLPLRAYRRKRKLLWDNMKFSATHVNNYFSTFCVKRIRSSVNDTYVHCRTPVHRRLKKQASSWKTSPKEPISDVLYLPYDHDNKRRNCISGNVIFHYFLYFYNIYPQQQLKPSVTMFLASFHGNYSFYTFPHVHLCCVLKEKCINKLTFMPFLCTF